MRIEFKPATYQPEQFVGREDDLKLVAEKVSQACRSGPVDRAIVHFHCVPRAGKTWLLSHLAHRYEREPRPFPNGKEVVVVFVDCATLRIHSDLDIRRNLLQACAAPFATRFTKPHYELKPFASPDEFLIALREWQDNLMLLFLLDSADSLDANDFAWAEESLLEPLVCSDQAVIVVAGRANSPTWKREQTRRRLDDHPLRAFSADETAEQARKRGFTGVIEDLYRQAYGHPYLTQLMVEAGSSLDDVRLRAILEHVESELLRDIPVEKHAVVRILALLRQFNLGTLREFLSEMMWADYTNKSDAFFLNAFLQERQGDGDWLLWSAQSGSYHLAPVVRGVLLQRLCLLDPTLYRQGLRVALKLYEQKLKRYPHDCSRLFREVIYYRTSLDLLDEQLRANSEFELKALLNHYLTEDFLTTDQAIALERDLKEDQALPEKLPSAACYQVLRSQLQQYIRKVSER